MWFVLNKEHKAVSQMCVGTLCNVFLFQHLFTINNMQTEHVLLPLHDYYWACFQKGHI